MHDARGCNQFIRRITTEVETSRSAGDGQLQWPHVESRESALYIGVIQVQGDSPELCELCHSLASESAAARLAIPALVEVNLSGEPTKSGILPEELEAFLSVYPDARGLMTMPPATGDPEDSRPYFRRLRELAEAHGLKELSMGTSQDYRVAAEEGATYVRVGSVLYDSA